MPAGPLTVLGIAVSGMTISALAFSTAEDARKKIEAAKARVDARIKAEEERVAKIEARRQALRDAKNPPPPSPEPAPVALAQTNGPRPCGRGRDLAGAQQRRLERIDRAAREAQEAQALADAQAWARAEEQTRMQAAAVFETPSTVYANVEPEEAFAMWVSEAIRVTGNEFDVVSDETIFASYTTYCEVNNYRSLEPVEVLQGLVVYSKPMGFVLVDRKDGDGWEMVYGQLNECSA